MSRKVLGNKVKEIFENHDSNDLQDALRDNNIGEKSFSKKEASKIVNFLLKCMDAKVTVVESPNEDSSNITFLYQKKVKATTTSECHCGKCKNEFSEKEMIKMTDPIIIKQMKLETSTFVCEDCVEAFWNE